MQFEQVNKDNVEQIRLKNFNSNLKSELSADLLEQSKSFLPNNAPDYKDFKFYNEEKSAAYLRYSKEVIQPILNAF